MRVQIAGRWIGDGHPTAVIAEIGINHSGSLETALQMVEAAREAGADFVKFQKRTVDVVYSADDLARPRESPFGTTNGDLKRALEFGATEYGGIAALCHAQGTPWFASPWDEVSVDFLEALNVPCHKVASACLTDSGLLRRIRQTGKPVILSTGMSTLAEIDRAMSVLDGSPVVLMHCTSTYPTALEEINLKAMETLRWRYGVPVGFSSHAPGPMPAVIAAALGAVMVEMHLTLDRASYGSDQAASLEPHGFAWAVKHIRSLPALLGDGEKRVYDSERPIIAKLRRVNA